MRVKEIILVILIAVLFSACNSQKVITERKVNVKKELSESKQQQYYYIFIEANRKKLLGDINGALALYYQCLEIDPNGAGAMSEISQINQVLKNWDTAIKYGKAAYEQQPDNKWYGLNLAKIYIMTQDYDQAIEIYEKVYENNKNDLEIPYNLAALYAHIKKFNKAIELYNVIEKRVGVNESLSLAKQQLYYSIGNKTKAYDEVSNLIKHYPSEPRYYGILAEMYTSDNLFIKAQENYDKLFEIDSTNTLGLLSIIDFYRKKMDYDNAFNTIEKVINDKNIEYNKKVMIFVSMLNNQSEFRIYNQQIKNLLLELKNLYPDKKDSYTLYADYLIKMNLLDEAKNEIEYILANYSGNVVLWEQLLSIYSFKSDFENLFLKSNVAIDSFPNHALFYLFNGVSANQTGRTEEVVKNLNNGLKLVENNPELELDFYTNLGEAYYNNKQYKESDYYFDLVLSRQPDNLYVINNYSYYLSLREEKLEYAETISRKTIEAEPNNSTYLDTYAWILYKLGRYQDALFYIKRAVDNGGVDSEVIVEHYGDIQFKVGNKNAAIELWKLAYEMGGDKEELLKKIENTQ